jgi:glycine betaine/proline transport system ATP-binding protein
MPNEKLRVSSLWKIFGKNVDAAYQLAKSGASTDSVRKATGAVVAVRDVQFSVAEGEIFVIMGLSGSGKSTLIRCINQLIEPTAGGIELDGEDTLRFSSERRREMRRRKISMVFQNFGLLPHRTVLENVEFGLGLRGEDKRTRETKARRCLEMVGLADWADRKPLELSGGMQQRVGLARALATDSDVLLMDEPFSALDPLIRRNLQDELLRLESRLKKTILFVTHDFHEAAKLGSRIAVMKDGEIVQAGSPREVIFTPINEYVRDFAMDIDRSRLLTAGDLLAKPLVQAAGEMLGASSDAPRIQANTPLFEVLPILNRHGRAFVVSNENVPLGSVSPTDLVRVLSTAVPLAPVIRTLRGA